MLLPLISRSFAPLNDFSAAKGGESPLNMLFPESSANFWLRIFFAVFRTGSPVVAS